MNRTTLQRLALSAATLLALAGPMASLPQPAEAAPSTSILISEVYGGGGNSGATLTNDFIELYNASDQPVDLTGWKVTYYSKAGGSGGSTTLTGTVPAHSHYLIQQAKGAGGTTLLPTPDATGTLTMSATDGSVELTSPDGRTIDLVGYGAASMVEGTATDALSSSLSAARRSVCTDTDANAADFTTGAPSPMGTSGGVQPCTVGEDPGTPTGEPSTVAQVQGASHTSPLNGQQVYQVPGIVTAVTSTGFYLQSTTPDDDPRTSEGVFVYSGKTSTGVKVGDEVIVDGTVTEFRPGGSSGANNLSTTEITRPAVTVTASGRPLPQPVLIGVDRVAPQQQVTTDDPGTVEAAGHVFDPTVNGIDFYESMEGMRAGVCDAKVVGPTAKFGEIPVVPGQNVQAVTSSKGGVVYSSYQHPNSMRVQLDDAILGEGRMPKATVGDRLRGDTVGVVDYSYSNVKLEVTTLGTHAPGGLQREVTAGRRGNELAVATFNVENLSPVDPQSKFDALAQQIVNNLRSPQVLALEEVQDNNGPQKDPVVDSTTTTDKLTAAIVAAGGPRYAAHWVNPENGADGGQPGGNIRSVFLVQEDGSTRFVSRPGATATTATTVSGTGSRTQLSHSPGLVNPTSPAWKDSRKPLAGEFISQGQKVFVIANHFSSKGGDQPLFGRFQQPVRISETKRHEQAQEVRRFVDQLLSANRGARVIVLGDINDFEFSQTANILVGAGTTAMTDLPRTLAPSERWTYVYEGNSQVLDHILLSPALATRDRFGQQTYRYDIVHTNSAFADQVSDHDPQVVTLNLRPFNGRH